MSVTRFARRRGFTLVELLVVCAVVAVLLSMVLFALRGAAEQARVDRTRAQITKIHDLMIARYEGYRERPLPMRVTNADPVSASRHRLYATWELMRMEIPDRKSDLTDNAAYLKQPDGVTPLQPSLWTAMRRKANALQLAKPTPGDWTTADWSLENQQAECLYLWLSTIRDGESTGLDFFPQSEIGDTDNDGMPEILDGWGTPIRFLRWAPGYKSVVQSQDPATQPDPFDPFKTNPTGYALVPLIFSAGPDRKFDLALDNNPAIHYSQTASPPYSMPAPNWPYITVGGKMLGEPIDAESDGSLDFVDNITNHLLVVR